MDISKEKGVLLLWILIPFLLFSVLAPTYKTGDKVHFQSQSDWRFLLSSIAPLSLLAGYAFRNFRQGLSSYLPARIAGGALIALILIANFINSMNFYQFYGPFAESFRESYQQLKNYHIQKVYTAWPFFFPGRKKIKNDFDVGWYKWETDGYARIALSKLKADDLDDFLVITSTVFFNEKRYQNIEQLYQNSNKVGLVQPLRFDIAKKSTPPVKIYRNKNIPMLVDRTILAADFNSTALNGVGWFAPEKWGDKTVRWAGNALESTLKVRLVLNKPFWLYIEAYTNLDDQALDIYMSGKKIGSFKMRKGWHRYGSHVPIINSKSEGLQVMDLAFRHKNYFIPPKSVSGNSDTRRLTAAYASILATYEK